nr:MAG TPA: hypothetical protein [Ackermannviridae sp.]
MIVIVSKSPYIVAVCPTSPLIVKVVLALSDSLPMIVTSRVHVLFSTSPSCFKGTYNIVRRKLKN